MKSDVIVVGVGGMGSSACYHLAKKGAKVLGLEQFQLVHSLGSSHGQTRIIRKAYFEHPDYTPLLLRAYELWGELSREAKHQLYHETGILYFSPKKSKLIQGLFESSSKYKILLEKLDKAQIKNFSNKFFCPDGYEAVFEPQSGYLEVENCNLHHSNLAKKHGATILTDEKVLSWSATKNEVMVKTDKNVYSASHLVITSGSWTDQLLTDLKLPLKILRKLLFWFQASSVYNRNDDTPCFLYDSPEGIFYGFPQLLDTKFGGLKVAEHSGGEHIADPLKIDRKLNPGDSDKVQRFVKNYLPGVESRVKHFETCMYTMTPDEHFIIDFHPQYKNVSFAGGFSGHGFKFASVVGEILSELALDGKSHHPIDFLKLRF